MLVYYRWLSLGGLKKPPGLTRFVQSIIIRKVAHVSFFNKHNEIIKILNIRGPRIDASGIQIKIHIHSLIVDHIFNFCFGFEK